MVRNNARAWIAAASALAGIPLAAFGLAGGGLLPALIGLALVLAFWVLAWQWLAGAGKPAAPIRPAADAAWNLREHPAHPSPPHNPKN